MAIVLNPEFFIPCIVGLGCLIFSIRMLIRSPAHKEPETQRAEDDIVVNPESETLEPGRKNFYVLLFAGLGIASIVFGMATVYPALNYAAKGIIVLTIIVSIALNARNDRRLENEKTAEDGANKTKPDA